MLSWTILEIRSDVYQNACVDDKWLNRVFQKPKTLLAQNQDISQLFTDDFSPKVYSTDISWLHVKWITEINTTDTKYTFGKPLSLLKLDQLCHLDLVEEKEQGQDILVQVWEMRVAVDSSRKIMKEITLGFHPKQRDRTLVVFVSAELSDEIFNIHMKFINSGIQIFTNLIVLALLPELNTKSREITKRRFQNTLQSNLTVEYIFEQDNLNFGEVCLFRNLILDGQWNSKLREHFCYVHCKSATFAEDARVEASIVELMYKFCFCNWDAMLAHPTAIQGGALKSICPFPIPIEPFPNWHYTGSFFWIKTSRLLADKLILTDQFTVDKLPGSLDPFGRQSLVFLDISSCDFNKARSAEFWIHISPFLTKPLPGPTVPSKYREKLRILKSYKKSIKKSLN